MCSDLKKNYDNITSSLINSYYSNAKNWSFHLNFSTERYFRSDKILTSFANYFLKFYPFFLCISF